MRRKIFDLFTFLFSCSLIALLYVSRVAKLKLGSIYTDTHGEEWNVPGNGTLNFVVEWVMDMIPRGDFTFHYVSPIFDMRNEQYNESHLIYLFFGVALAVLFILICSIILIAQYCCGCCGGKLLPRAGYSTFQIDSTRGSILVLSFILEFMLIYGYFSTTDMDNAMGTLSDRFEEYSTELSTQFDTLISSLPDSLSSYYDKESFKNDLEYTVRSTKADTDQSLSLFNSYERWRMLLIIVGLIAATVACSVGIAAGAVHRSWPIVVMVILSIIGGAILLFSFCYHFTFAKILREFCTDSGTYVDERNDQFLPQRLQYFLPCLNSPLYSYISDHYFINAILETQNFANSITDPNIYKPTFNNVSSTYYSDYVASISDQATKESLQKQLTTATNISELALVIDQSQTCRWTKTKLRDEQFLMCSFTMDAVEMLTLTQAVAALLMVIITYIAIGAIKKFKWAATVNNKGLNQNNGGFAGRPPTNKRK